MKRYFKNYMSGWKISAFKEAQKKDPNFLYRGFAIPMWYIFSCWICNKSESLIWDLAMGICVFLPGMLVTYSTHLHPLNPVKAFYLLPMNEEERYKEIRATYIFRVCMHLLLFAIGILGLVLLGFGNPLSMVYLLLIEFVLSTAIPATVDEIRGYYSLVAILPIGLLTIFMQLVILSGIENQMVFQAIAYGVFAVIILPIFVGYQKHIAAKLRQAACYEEVKTDK